MGNFSCDVDVDLCHLWYPKLSSAGPNEPITVYTHYFEDGLTNLGLGKPDDIVGLVGQLGYGPESTSPIDVPQDWTWFAMDPDEAPPAFVGPPNDRWMGTLFISIPGTYDYASRFSLDGGYTWLYCDLDGSNNGYDVEQAGTALVQ